MWLQEQILTLINAIGKSTWISIAESTFAERVHTESLRYQHWSVHIAYLSVNILVIDVAALPELYKLFTCTHDGRQQVPPKCSYLSIRLNYVRSQNSSTYQPYFCMVHKLKLKIINLLRNSLLYKAVSKSPINLVIISKPVYNHSYVWQY